MHYKILPILLITLLAFSCKKKKVEEPDAPQTLHHGMLVLNEFCNKTIPPLEGSIFQTIPILVISFNKKHTARWVIPGTI